MYLLIAFSVYTGMRAGEILALNWEDIDVDAGTARVRNPKNGRERIAHLRKSLETLLDNVEERERHGAIIINPRTGDRLQSYKTAWKTIRETAGIPTSGPNRIRFHDLRHTFATLMHANGVDTKVVKDLIGHKKLESTLIYTHMTDTVMKQSIDDYDAMINQE